MSATGLILDGILMLLLIGAVAFGIRLERKLAALRAGQAEFAKAVTELNAAAGKAENALMALKSAGQDTDLLHDRIVKGRQLKAELEALIARGGARETVEAAAAPSVSAHSRRATSPSLGDGEEKRISSLLRSNGEGDRAGDSARVVEGAARSSHMEPAPDQAAERASLILQALAANQTAQQSLNRARRKLDEDLFAA